MHNGSYIPAKVRRLTFLEHLSFGADVAENDAALDAHFLQTSAYWAVVNDEVDLVLGPKGSGKSAIARYLCSETVAPPELMSVDIIPAFNIRGNVIFRRLQSTTLASGADAQRNFFFAYMLGLVGNHILEAYAGGPVDVAPLREILEKLHIVSSRSGYGAMFRRVLERFRVDAKVGIDESGMPTFTGSAALTEDNGKSKKIDDALEEDLENLATAVCDFYETIERKCWIVFDRLDEAFAEDRELEAEALRGLLRAHLDLCSYTPLIRPKLFLRSDVLARVTARKTFTNFTHIRSLDVRWSSDMITKLIALRVAQSGALSLKGLDVENMTPAAVLMSLLPKTMGDEDTLAWMYLVSTDATRELNPRNVVTLLGAAQLQAVQNAHSELHEADVNRLQLTRKELNFGYEELARKRLSDTVLAESGISLEVIESLKGSTLRFSREEVGVRTGQRDEELNHLLKELVSTGLLRKDSNGYVVGPLYKYAMYIEKDRSTPVSAERKERRQKSGSPTRDFSLPAGITAAASADKSENGQLTATKSSPTAAASRANRNSKSYREGFVNTSRPSDVHGEERFLEILKDELASEGIARGTDSRLDTNLPLWLTIKNANSLAQSDQHQQAMDLLRSRFSRRTEALVAIADIAARSGDPGLRKSACHLLESARYNETGALGGRLVFLKIVDDNFEVASSIAKKVNPTQVPAACIALIAIADVNFELESHFWHQRARAHDEGALDYSVRVIRALPVLAASRVLSLARKRVNAEDVTPRVATLEMAHSFWRLEKPSLVRALQGVCWAYVRDPSACFPPLLPYQVLSMSHVLQVQEALPGDLKTQLAETIRAVINQSEPKHQANFQGWAEYSELYNFFS